MILYAFLLSSYFVPIARPRKKGQKQLEFDTEWTQDRIEENKLVNQVRARVKLWREGGYIGVTPTTSRLLAYWTDPDREKKLFFCQIEALETAIYLTEVAKKYGDTWIENDLRDANDSSNPGLPRTAFKMATGSGKTVVMAMLIAWHTLNKLANPQDVRFSDTFLVVTPGITIRDRLRVLLPNDPQNYYRQRDVLSSESLEQLGRAKILITNFHALQLREKVTAGKLTKAILAQGETGTFTETPDQMVRRVCRELGTKKRIVVLNDEAHHCYRRKPDGEELKLKGDERKEAKQREEDARVWISGIEAVKGKIGVKAIYDLSATPFFLRGSGYPEGTLFPWVVSDFSLIDAIEAGIVKVPRVPVSDDSMTGEQPTYRDLWLRIREELPKKGRKTEKVGGEPSLPGKLQGALHSLYGNYEKYYRLWENNAEARAKGITPPVFIVVCNNCNVSKLVFDYIAGWEKQIGENTFPRLLGYRYDLDGERLTATFGEDSKLSLSTADVPTKTENAPIVGESSIHTLDDLKRRRPNEVAFLLAKLTLEKYFRQDGEERADRPKEHKFDGEVKSWLFPQMLDIAKRWLAECVVLKDNTFPQLLLLIEFAHDAADRIYKAIVQASEGTAALKPTLRPYDTVGSTRYVDFDTTRPIYATREDKCHISHVVADTDSWEQKLAQTLEDMDEVVRYVKNHNLGFAIPYTLNGQAKNYIPDFIACLGDGHGPDDLLNLLIEVTGEKKKDKAAKVATAQTLWVPAVNNHGGFGRWAFIEIDDPWDAENTIKAKYLSR